MGIPLFNPAAVNAAMRGVEPAEQPTADNLNAAIVGMDWKEPTVSNEETLRYMRLSACIENQIPVEHANRLNGDNADEINHDARAFPQAIHDARQARPTEP
jgi:hypothetical protein